MHYQPTDRPTDQPTDRHSGVSSHVAFNSIYEYTKLILEAQDLFSETIIPEPLEDTKTTKRIF